MAPPFNFFRLAVVCAARLVSSAAGAATALAFGLVACGGGGGGGAAEPTAADTATEIAARLLVNKVAVATASASGSDPSASASNANLLTLRASAQMHNDVGALLTVRYNGVALASQEVRASSATVYQFALGQPFTGGLVDVVFTNAGGPEGFALRHVTIESLRVGDIELLPTDATTRFDRGEGLFAFDGLDVSPGRNTLAVNGALRFTVAALGTAAQTATNTAAGNAKDAASGPTNPVGFYIDAALGSDSNTGTLDSPWRTLNRVKDIRLQSGQGLYLRCGRTWRESLSLTAVHLVDGTEIAGFGPECASQKATISGADNFSGGWRKDGPLWVRSLPAGTPKISQLFVEGQGLRTAQWPNAVAAGPQSAIAARSTSPTQRLSFQPPVLSLLAGKDLVGATVQMRSQPWLVETRKVAQVSNSELVFDRVLTWSLDAGEGLVLQDKLWMLDSPGEFFHDLDRQLLFVIAPSAGAPADLNSALVEGSVRDAALQLAERRNLVVRDLALNATRDSGLHMTDAPSARLSQLHMQNNGLAGVRLYQWQPLAFDVPGSVLTDSLVANNGQYGIDAQYVGRATISKNQVLATGTAPWHQAAVSAGIAAGPGARVEDNTVDGAGYNGIVFSTLRGSVVARNTVAGYCVRLSDCAAIYSWAGRALATADQSASIENNRLLGATAQIDGTASEGGDVVAGIYIDDFARGVAVRGNLVHGAPYGIFIHNASNNTIENNRIWLPSKAGLWASMDQTDADWMTGNVFRNNQIVPLVQASITPPGANPLGTLPQFAVSQAVWFWHSLDGEAALAAGRNTFSGNDVVQLQGALAQHAWLRGAGKERFVDAPTWRQLQGSDGAVQRPLQFESLQLTLGAEAVVNGEFTQGMSAWRTYQNPAGTGFATQVWPSLAGCNGPCVSLAAGHRGDLLASQAFTLRAGAAYVYRLQAAMPSAGAATVAPPYISRETTPWDAMYDTRNYTSLRPLTGTAQEVLAYEMFFVAKETAAARINLQLETLGKAVAFNSVSLREVLSYRAAVTTDWAAVAWATAGAARSVHCADLGWPATCQVVALDGQAVPMPLLLAAGTERLLLRADSAYRR